MSDDLLAGAEPAITRADMVACIQRELKMRRSVYPRRVAKGQMHEGAARREIAIMEAVLRLLEDPP